MLGRRISRAVLGLLIWLLLPSAACAGWREMAPMPEPRWFHAAGLGSDGRIYAFGGHVLPEGRPVRQHARGEYAMVVYDPETDSWSRGPEPPPYRATLRDANLRRTPEGEWYLHPWETTVEAKVRHELAIGAGGGKGEIYWFTLAAPLIFNPGAGAWSQRERLVWYQSEQRYEGSVPAYSRSSAAMTSDPDGRIYFLGGVGAPILEARGSKRELLRHAELYDPETNTWSEIAPMQRARQLFAACFGADGKLYVFGGYGHHGTITQQPGESYESFAQRGAEMRALGRQALDSVEVWDPETDTWSWRAPMLLGVEGAGAALGADGRIYVVGGTPSFSNPKPVARVQVYDPGTDTWSRGPSLREARQSHAVVGTPEGRIYAIGGTNVHRVFHPVQIVGGDGGSRGRVLDSVEVLETAPRRRPSEPQPAPPDRG